MKQDNILLIETSGNYCSVALCQNGTVIAEKSDDRTFSHSEMLAPFVQQILAESEVKASFLSAIGLSAGPGSYTGLRVGASLAKAMCYALGIPLIAIDTLEAIASASRLALGTEAIYVPNIDARRMEVYYAAFDRNGTRVLPGSALVIDSSATLVDLLIPDVPIVFCGSGTEKCTEVLTHERITLHHLEVEAKHLAPIAIRSFGEETFADLVTFKPEYIKAPNITIPGKARL